MKFRKKIHNRYIQPVTIYTYITIEKRSVTKKKKKTINKTNFRNKIKYNKYMDKQLEN